ncbi:MAG: thiamine phosphate synthase, partial [bacterium]|nr:thiamine phosphate synthase [bacterium]
PHKLLGRTTHSLDQGVVAQADGADYVSVGPIWDTPSKPNRAGIGFDYLKEANTQLTIPFVAIGGINTGNIDDILPYSPPLIGLIRDFENIPSLQAKLIHV